MTKRINSSQEIFKIISDTFQRWGRLKELKAYEIHAAKRKDWKNEKHIRHMSTAKTKIQIGRIKKHMIRHTCCKDGED
jgi:hypothetical protein